MANIMKVLSPLTASVGLSVSGSQGLIVTHGSISGSSNLLVGGQITGSSGAKITGEISASTVVGDGSGLTGVAKPSDLTNFATRSEVTGVLGSYATLTGVSASFATPAQVTGAISDLPTRTEVTGAISTATTNFATRAEVTGVLGSYATLSGVSASFSTPAQVTGALATYATLSGVSASFVAKDGSGNVTIAGDLTVNGTTTTVDTTNLLVEDAVIQLGSGSSGNADGDRGFIFSRNSENKAFFWDENDSKFKLAATTTAGNTNTIVAGAAQGLDVGALTATSVSASGDVTAVTGFKGGGGKYLAQLTQSQFNSGPGGIYTTKVSGTAISDAFGNSGDKTALKFRHISSSQGQGQEYDDVTIQIYDGNTFKSSMAIDGATFSVDIGTVAEENDGPESSLLVENASATILGSGSVVIKARDQGNIKLGEGSNNTLLKYNGSNFAGVKQDEGGGDYYLNLVSTFDALSGALDSGPVVSPSDYYSLRVSTRGMTQMGSSPGLVQFFLSGSPGTNASNEGNTNQVTASCPLGLSGSTGDACMANFAYAMFDVAVKNGGTNSLWTNDLVSVQVSASQSGSTGDFYPFITVEGAGLSDGVQIRLIVVNEESNKIS